jgi:integrase
MIETDERNAAHDALDAEQFERLYAATNLPDDDYITRVEDRFIVVAGGKLGLRRGEIAHFSEEWLNREKQTLTIPRHETCTCSYCNKRAREYAENNDMTAEEALEHCWSPKTEASVRTLFYGFSEQVVQAVEELADVVGEFDKCPLTVNDRVNKLAERAGLQQNLYPHALRATAGIRWADLGLEAHYLQAWMGWSSIEVAVHYLRVSGSQIAARIERAMTEEMARDRTPLYDAEDLEQFRAERDALRQARMDDDDDEDGSQTDIGAF